MKEKPVELEITGWMDALQDKKVYQGKSLRELFYCGDVPLWWFIRPLLLYPTIQQLAKAFKAGKDLQSVELNKVKLILAEQYIKTRDKIRASLGNKTLQKSISAGTKPKILAITLTKSWKSYEDHIKGSTVGDSLIGPVISELERLPCDIVCVDADYSKQLNFRILRDKVSKGHFILETYLTSEGRKKAENRIKEIKVLWNSLKQEASFKDLFVYEGKNIFNALNARLETVFSELYLFRVIRALEAINNMIETEKPSVILTSIEKGYYGLALTYIARKRGIPVIGIQHAMIANATQDYTHKKVTLSVESLDYPIVDKTAVYGNASKRLLMRSGYPKSTIAVTGQPRYDQLENLRQKFNKKEFCAAYGLDPDKKIFAIMGQILNSQEERDKFLRGLLRALKNFPELQIVVKPKAHEEWHRQVVKEEYPAAVVLPAEMGAFEPLLACDFMATVTSTTALEAMMLEKFVLIINLTNQSAAQPYIESGAALYATKEDNIGKEIQRLLNDNKVRLRLKKSMKKFVSENVYKNDGKSSARVADLIYKEATKTRLKKLPLFIQK